MSSVRRALRYSRWLKPTGPSIAGLIGGCLISLSLLANSAHATTLQAFDAIYHLEIDGWPDTNIEHRVSRVGEHWRSEMSARIAIARGNESSRFIEDDDRLSALGYSGSYRMLGRSKDYRFDAEQLTPLTDRQTALIELSRQAQERSCLSDCSISFIDHKGREKTAAWQLIDPVTVVIGDQAIQAPTISLQPMEKPGRNVVISFHPEIPGLILNLGYFKQGQQVNRLSLLSFEQH